MTLQNILRRFRSDERGASTLEFTLLAMPLIIVAFCVIQFLLLAHAMIVIKGAAHAAARSALVNMCRPFNVSEASGNVLGALVDSYKNKCTDDQEAWETAARIALLPISASYARNQQCDYPDAVVQLLQQEAVRDGLTQTLENKACYAFEPANVTVEVRWETQAFGVQITEGPPPISARVTFRVPLLAPTRKIFGAVSGTVGGTYYLERSATVTLL